MRSAGTAPGRAGGGAAPGSWELHNSPYTVEGEIEGFGRLASGAQHAGGTSRAAVTVLVVTLLLFLGLSVVQLLVEVFRG